MRSITFHDRMDAREMQESENGTIVGEAITHARYAESFPKSYTTEAVQLSQRLLIAIGDGKDKELISLSLEIMDRVNLGQWRTTP